ncbi:hypothetical protein GQX74_002358 [Glossina fuscipes]|nr:hypothetical protein GQX74_002358 [Glossina fuscipes]
MTGLRFAWFYITALLILTSFVAARRHNLKILGLFPHPGISHFHFFHPIMRSLAERGHEVTVVSHFPDKSPPVGYHDISLGGKETLANIVDLQIFENRRIYNHFVEFFMLYEWGKVACNHTIRSDALTRLMRQDNKFDVILMEQFNTDCMMGVAHLLRAPVIALSSCALMPWHYERMGSPIIPSYIPALFLGQSEEMSLPGRLANWISFHVLKLLYDYYSIPAADAILRYKFGQDMPSVGELAKETALMFVNQHFSLSGPKPLPPSVIELGGVHIQKAKPLDVELQRFLDNAEYGVILISWGSMIRAETMPAAKRDAIVKAVKRLKQRVIWKWENDSLINKPDNMYISKWLPQRDILCHPKVKIFMTHAGLMGSSEAAYCGTPVIATPIYHESAKAVSYAYKHRPQTALETAMWWVEYVAATEGATLLKSHSVHMSRFTYYCLDTYLVLSSVTTLSILSCFVILRKIGLWRKKLKSKSRRSDVCYPDFAKEAVTKALSDAKIPYTEVQQAAVGYVYGDSTCGQRALYEVGMTAIPVYNVNNNCSTGASALFLAKQIVESGNADCVLALGFEKMERGSLSSKYFDRANPMERHVTLMSELTEIGTGPMAAQIFGNAGKEHMEKYGTKPEHFAKIAWKNHKHSVNNPYSQFQDEYTLEQIMQSPQVVDGVLTKLQCCPTSDGSAAAILASETFVRRHGLEKQAVEIVGMEMATDPESTFKDRSLIKIAGYDMTKLAASRLFAMSNCKPSDVQVVELHDCFSANELITYEALGLCKEGKAAELIDSGDNTYGGKYVINPSGGLISKGHPLGATGLAQCAELCWQLRGQAGKRQVKNCKLALQHNLGLGGAVVVTLYRLGFPASANVKFNLTSATSATGEGFKVTPLLKLLEQAMMEDQENLIEKVRAVYGFKVVNGPNGQTGYWTINAKEGKGKITYNGKEKCDVTFIMSDEDVSDLITGKLAPQKAFFQGKIKIQGNMGFAIRLMDLQRSSQDRIEAIRAKL